MKSRGRPRHPDVLTPREWKVHSLLREGLSNEEIATRLEISLATAKYHVSEIITKLGVCDRREAARWPDDAYLRAWLVGLGGLRPKALAPALQVASASVIVVMLLAVGLLLWGLTRTESGSSEQRLVAPSWTIADIPTRRPSVIVFDLETREARRVDLGTTTGFLQWVNNDDVLVGYDSSASEYRSLRLDGTTVRSLLPQPGDGTLNSWLAPANDGRRLVVNTEEGELALIDAFTGDSAPFDTVDGAETSAQFAVDGSRFAYLNRQNSYLNDQAVRVAGIGSSLILSDGLVFATLNGDDVALELAPNAWSSDGTKILMMQSGLGALCGPNCPEFAGAREYRVYGMGGATNSFIWTSKGTLIIDAVWAGPDRLFVTKYEVVAGDTTWSPAFIGLTNGEETPATGLLASCCTLSPSFSPDGRFAVSRVGTSGPVTCSAPDDCDAPDWDLGCALIDTSTGSEVVRIDGTDADIGTAFCVVVSWTSDGTKAIASAGGN